MSEFEAQALLIEYAALAHSYGESIWGRVDLWIGVSSGLIVMAYFAPERLTKSLTTLILVLYVALSIFVFTNGLADFEKITQVAQTANALADENGIEIEVTELGVWLIKDILSLISLFVFFTGLFLGAIGYVASVCLNNYKLEDRENDT